MKQKTPLNVGTRGENRESQSRQWGSKSKKVTLLNKKGQKNGEAFRPMGSFPVLGGRRRLDKKAWTQNRVGSKGRVEGSSAAGG